MKTNEFRRVVTKTLEPKTIKTGVRNVLRKAKTVNLMESIIGVRYETGNLMEAMRPYILGFQLTPQVKANAKESMGCILHHAVNAAKLLKVKVPSSQRKVKVQATPTSLLTDLDAASNHLLEGYYAAHQGNNLDEATIIKSIEGILADVYQLQWALYGAPVATLMDEHLGFLKTSYPEGFFTAPPKKTGPSPFQKAQPVSAQTVTDVISTKAIAPKAKNVAKKASPAKKDAAVAK